MVVSSVNELYYDLEKAQCLFSNLKHSGKKLAMGYYIINLFSSLSCMGENIDFDIEKSFGSLNNYNEIIQTFNRYYDSLLNNYVSNKKIHKQYLENIVINISKIIDDYTCLVYPSFENIKEDEFWEIFFSFCKSLDLESMFDSFYKTNCIYSTINQQKDRDLGFVLFNPFFKNNKIFIYDFKYDFFSMNILAHEFGHAYDFFRFNGNINDYNKYIFSSFYIETIPLLFERLLYYYCIDNNIMINSVKMNMINFELTNYYILLNAYLISLYDKKNILQEDYLICNYKKILKKINYSIYQKVDIQEILKKMDSFSFSEIYGCAYGDIISMFLCDKVRKNSLNNDSIHSFFTKRNEICICDFLKENNFSSKEYINLYKDELKLIKK